MKKELSNYIKQQALDVGFDACGITKAEFLKEDSVFFSHWIAQGFHSEMSYLERNADKRYNPALLVDDCKSVIVVALNYYPQEHQQGIGIKIAKYAFSKIDYHAVLKNKLLELKNRIVTAYGEECFSASQQHIFVDSAPVLERRLGEKAGLGWIGKNKMLIHPQLGSFFFLGELFINKELAYDAPIKNRCGNCTKCLEACPTKALSVQNGLDSNLCISYQTIENKKAISPEVTKYLSNYIFGCDICNDVCPWNKTRAKPHHHKELEPVPEIIHWSTTAWNNLLQAPFNSLFKYSAIKRAKFEKLKQNISFVTNNTPTGD